MADVLTEVSAKLPQPLIVHLSTASNTPDPRTIRAARTSAEAGYPTLILGISTAPVAQTVDIDGVAMVLVPAITDPWDQVIQAWDKRLGAIRAARFVRRLGNIHREVLRHFPRYPELAQPRWADNDPRTLRITLALTQALDELRPALVQVHHPLALPAAVAHASHRAVAGHVKTIYDAHELLAVNSTAIPDSSMIPALAAAERDYIRDVTEVVTISESIARAMHTAYRLTRRPTVVSDAPDVDTDPDGPSLHTELGLSSDTPVAVCSAAADSQRGIGTLIKALAAVPELHLALIDEHGDGDPTLIDLAEQAGVAGRVHRLSTKTGSPMPVQLTDARVAVIARNGTASLNYSIPAQFTRYLVAGLPVVVNSANVATAAVVRSNEIGEIFKTDSLPDLAEKLRLVLADTDRYRAAITPGLVSEHQWTTQQARLAKRYAGLVKAPTPKAAPNSVTSALNVPTPDETATLDTGFPAGRLGDVSVGIGRANSAGQAYYWAEALAEASGCRVASFAPSKEITHDPHRIVPSDMTSALDSTAELATIIRRYTHLIIDGFGPLLGRLVGDDIEAEIALLRRQGIAIALAAHGSEVRDPIAHMERFDESFFHSVSDQWRTQIEVQATRNREIAAAFDGPIFVSTPDLLFDLPQATWLPVVVDQARWNAVPELGPRDRPKVLHRPSRAHPPIKGSEVIVPVLEALDARGVIEYIVDQGQIPAAEMPSLVARADIVIDQIRTGSYGVAAVEAMAAGRVVIGNLDQTVRQAVPDPIPIIDGPPDRLEAALVELAEDPDQRLALGRAGRDFAAKWHSGAVSAKVLLPFITRGN